MKGVTLDIKTVGKSGQISLGKSLAGTDFIMEELPGGDIILKRAIVIPANERWLHDPTMKKRLAAAEKWLHDHPIQETDLERLEDRLSTAA
jgi:hypothetical protein